MVQVGSEVAPQRLDVDADDTCGKDVLCDAARGKDLYQLALVPSISGVLPLVRLHKLWSDAAISVTPGFGTAVTRPRDGYAASARAWAGGWERSGSGTTTLLSAVAAVASYRASTADLNAAS